MQPLLAKVVELELAREVGPDDVLHLLRHRRLVRVPVDLGERLVLLCKKNIEVEYYTLAQGFMNLSRPEGLFVLMILSLPLPIQ